MSTLAQDLVVGLVALGAVGYVIRQIVGAFRPDSTDRACEHCDPVGSRPPKPPPR